MKPNVLLQYLLPHHALSKIVYRATRWTWQPWKNYLIQRVMTSYQVNLREAAQSNPRAYPHFNAFFTRALRSGERPLAPAPALLSPADGRISQAGTIETGRIFQAKGQVFSATELLADEAAAQSYRDGSFLTIYLSPRDYHRVHMPLAGRLQETVHIPGRLFSVAPFAVAAIPRLFARNERLVCHFKHDGIPFAVVLVGAMLVSSVATVWDGLVIPPYASAIRRQTFTDRHIQLAAGAELGRFNMGSTVILLLPPRLAELAVLTPQQPVQMGEALGRLLHLSA